MVARACVQCFLADGGPLALSVPRAAGRKHSRAVRGRSPARTAAEPTGEDGLHSGSPGTRWRQSGEEGAAGAPEPRAARPSQPPRAPAWRASSRTAPPTASLPRAADPSPSAQYELPAAVADSQLGGASGPSTPCSMEPSYWLWATEKAGRADRCGARTRCPAASRGMLGAEVRARAACWELESFSGKIKLSGPADFW